MRGGKNNSWDFIKVNNLSCNEIRSQDINRRKGKHQDSESKGSKDAGTQIVSFKIVCRFN